MAKKPFRYFKPSPEIIQPDVLLFVFAPNGWNGPIPAGRLGRRS